MPKNNGNETDTVDHGQPVNSKWSAKRTARTFRKLRDQLLQLDPSLDISTPPNTTTAIIALYNAGLPSGFANDELRNLVANSESLAAIVTPADPTKNFSIFHFDDADAAHSFYRHNHGNMTQTRDGAARRHACAFLSHVPSLLIDESAASRTPDGLELFPDFVSNSTEAQLLAIVDNELKTRSESSSSTYRSLNRRRALHFGYSYDYDTRSATRLDGSVDMPPLFNTLREQIELAGKLARGFLNQLTVNVYRPGDGISAHVEETAVFDHTLAALSLESDIVMDFTCCKDDRKSCVDIPRRSLYLLKGASRFQWKHAIAPRMNDKSPIDGTIRARQRRISLTFRRVLPKFSAGADDDTLRLESEHVRQVYDTIATHFSNTRYRAWPKVADFLRGLPADSLVLDVGCGNGKYGVFAKENELPLHVVGMDFSSSLAAICAERGLEACCADNLAIPFRNELFDCAISIAVLHHFANYERRRRALREMLRVLRRGALALVYVWAFEQSAHGKYLKHGAQRDEQRPVDVIDSLPVHRNRTEFAQQDVLVPWKMRKSGAAHDAETTVHRYYHVFRSGELRALCQSDKSLCACIVEEWYDDGNWCIVLQKL